MKIGLLATFLMIFAGQSVFAESFNDLQQALKWPEKATKLSILTDNASIKHLPPELGNLVNLVELEIACLESLEDLPNEIANLKKLKILNLDNGNGCAMNIAIPETIGALQQLEVLNLDGALGTKSKALPDGVRNLTNLRDLNLGKSRFGFVPPQIAALHKLEKLSLDYSDIHDIPSFVGELKNLRELSLCGIGGVKLPASLAKIKGLKISIGSNRLTLKDQQELRRRFPKAELNFESEYDDASANEEQQE